MSPRMAFATSCTSAFGKFSVTSLGCELPAEGRCGAVNVWVPGNTGEVSVVDDGRGPSAAAAPASSDAHSAVAIRRFIGLSLVAVVFAVVTAVVVRDRLAGAGAVGLRRTDFNIQ